MILILIYIISVISEQSELGQYDRGSGDRGALSRGMPNFTVLPLVIVFSCEIINVNTSKRAFLFTNINIPVHI